MKMIKSKEKKNNNRIYARIRKKTINKRILIKKSKVYDKIITHTHTHTHTRTHTRAHAHTYNNNFEH